MRFKPVRAASPRTKKAIAGTALAALLIAGLIFAKVATHDGPRTAGAASASLFVAAGGDWNAAYQQATPGQTIEVAGGTYPDTTVRDRPGIGTAPITFRIADGATATINGSLEIQSHDVIVEGGGTVGVDEPNRIVAKAEVDATMASVGMGDRNVVIEDVHGASAYVHADGVTVRDSEFGPSLVCNDSDGGNDDLVKLWYWLGSNGDRGSRHINFLNNLVHGNNETGCTGSPHDDGIQMELDDSLVSGNRVWDCGTQCMFQGYNSTGLVVENNMVEQTSSCPRCGDSSEVGMAGTLTFRNNTVYGNVTFSGGSVPSKPTVYNNVFLAPQGCDPAATYDHNVFPSGGSACGTNAKRGTPTFATVGALGSRSADFHLAATDNVAQDAGDPSRFAPNDIDGQVRPVGAGPDDGADEVAGPVPPPTTTVATTTAQTTTAQTTTAPPPPCGLENTYRQSLTDLRASTLYGSYKKANPNEWKRVDPWLTNPTSVSPSVATATGRFLVGHGRLYLLGCQ